MEAHRPGPFKQRNKAHKAGKKRSARDTANSGRVRTTSIGSVRSLSSKAGSSVSRNVRKNQLIQLRKLKREELLNNRRGIKVAPILIAVLNLDDLDNDACLEQLFTRLQFLDPSGKSTISKRGNYLHLELPKFRTTYQIVALNKQDLYGAIDLAKIADILLLLHSRQVEAILDAQQKSGQQTDGFYLLEAIYNHCLPQTVHGIVGLSSNPKQKDRIRKSIQNLVEQQYPGTLDSGNALKLRLLDSAQDLLQLFHYCSNVKRKPNSYCSRRSQLLAERIQFEPLDGDNGTLLVDGYIRGTSFNANALVYVPEFGEFQLEKVQELGASENPFQNKKNSKFQETLYEEDADFELIPSLDERENPVETLHEQEMADLGDGDEDFNNQEDEEEMKTVPKIKKEKKKVPKGTSEYQAAWIIESDEENDDGDAEDSEGEDDEMDTDLIKTRKVSFAPVDQVFDDELVLNGQNNQIEDNGDAEDSGEDVEDPNYDQEMNMEEDETALAKFKEERMYELFPDEIDTPANVSARERFAKYRGLKSFRTSVWDAKENLPPDYSRISQFENFNRTKRRLFKTDPVGADSGYYVRVRVANVPRTLFEYYEARPDKPLILFQLLAHEHKMSVQNIVLKKVATFPEPIQSKEELIFHIGARRFAARPIFSAHSVGDKHKYEKFLRSDVACVATIYAPITFPPTPVLVYKQYPDGQQVLVATGSLLDCSPDRIVIKRYILSGHPFKINRKHAVVRYMFFNRDDILWFRPVELRTKYGRRGHIREPLGTHGHMKCVFDHQLSSQDTVLMTLYKRVFPKWSYQATGLTEPVRAPVDLARQMDDDEQMGD